MAYKMTKARKARIKAMGNKANRKIGQFWNTKQVKELLRQGKSKDAVANIVRVPQKFNVDEMINNCGSSDEARQLERILSKYQKKDSMALVADDKNKGYFTKGDYQAGKYMLKLQNRKRIKSLKKLDVDAKLVNNVPTYGGETAQEEKTNKNKAFREHLTLKPIELSYNGSGIDGFKNAFKGYVNSSNAALHEKTQLYIRNLLTAIENKYGAFANLPENKDDMNTIISSIKNMGETMTADEINDFYLSTVDIIDVSYLYNELDFDRPFNRLVDVFVNGVSPKDTKGKKYTREL